MENLVIITSDRGGFIKVQTPTEYLHRYNNITKHAVAVTFQYQSDSFFYFGYENGRVDIYEYNGDTSELQLIKLINTPDNLPSEELSRHEDLRFYQPPYSRLAIINIFVNSQYLMAMNQQNNIFLYAKNQTAWQFQQMISMPVAHTKYYANYAKIFSYKYYVLMLLEDRIYVMCNKDGLFSFEYLCRLKLVEFNYLSQFTEKCEVSYAHISTDQVNLMDPAQSLLHRFKGVELVKILHLNSYASMQDSQIRALNDFLIKELKIPENQILGQSDQEMLPDHACLYNSPDYVERENACHYLVVGDIQGRVYRFDMFQLDYMIRWFREGKKERPEYIINTFIYQTSSTEDQKYKITSITDVKLKLKLLARMIIFQHFNQMLLFNVKFLLNYYTKYKHQSDKSQDLFNFQAKTYRNLVERLRTECKLINKQIIGDDSLEERLQAEVMNHNSMGSLHFSCFDSSGRNHVINCQFSTNSTSGGACGNYGSIKCQTSYGTNLIFGGYEKFLVIYDLEEKKVVYKNYMVHDLVGVAALPKVVPEPELAEAESEEVAAEEEEGEESEALPERPQSLIRSVQTDGLADKELDEAFFDGF